MLADFEDAPDSYPPREYEFSQATFGGGMACTSCAILAACTYADGMPLNARLVTEVGAKMWQARGNNRSEDTQEIVDKDRFFTDTYEFDVWQCSFTGAEGRGDLKHILDKMRRSEHSGVVFTDGTVSFAVGWTGAHADGKWVVFDSHPPSSREWLCDTEPRLVAVIKGLLLCKSVFDCSIVIRRRLRTT